MISRYNRFSHVPCIAAEHGGDRKESQKYRGALGAQEDSSRMEPSMEPSQDPDAEAIRKVNAELSTGLLTDLLRKPSELRPGVEALIRTELSKRGVTAEGPPKMDVALMRAYALYRRETSLRKFIVPLGLAIGTSVASVVGTLVVTLASIPSWLRTAVKFAVVAGVVATLWAFIYGVITFIEERRERQRRVCPDCGTEHNPFVASRVELVEKSKQWPAGMKLTEKCSKCGFEIDGQTKMAM
jgi:hypothetical protein